MAGKYRELKRGEVIKVGDLIWVGKHFLGANRFGWKETALVGERVHDGIFRRPLKSAVAQKTQRKAKKKVSAAVPVAQHTQRKISADIVDSISVCAYCRRLLGGKCMVSGCRAHSRFSGRKLRLA